jgi:hypothetical protein
LEGRKSAAPRDHVFSEYLENEEAFVRTERWKFICCTGRRERTDGYKTDQPTPGPYVRLYDLTRDKVEMTDVAGAHRDVVAQMQDKMLTRFRATHPEAKAEPAGMKGEEAIAWYLRPRDA